MSRLGLRIYKKAMTKMTKLVTQQTRGSPDPPETFRTRARVASGHLSEKKQRGTLAVGRLVPGGVTAWIDLKTRTVADRAVVRAAKRLGSAITVGAPGKVAVPRGNAWHFGRGVSAGNGSHRP